MSLANNDASRFSKPSPRVFENGRLLGSAQTRSTRSFVSAPAETSSSAPTAHALGKGEDIQHPSLRSLLRQGFHHVHESERRPRITPVEAAPDDAAGPAAPTPQPRDGLVSLRLVGH